MAENVQKDDDVKVKQRTILWFLVFTGFSINYMIRINVNIALIDMLDTVYRKPSNTPNVSIECVATNDVYTNDTENLNNDLIENEHTRLSLERRILDFLSIDYDRDGFNWNEKIQGQILGSFFSFHFLLQLPGGILAAKYGTKLIFGVANFIGCILSSFMPIAAYIDYRILIALKVLQGIICSMCWPSMHHLSAQWIPADERGRFVSSYLGSSFGVAIFYPIFGFIMKAYSWEYVFHFCSLIGLIWWISWQYFVYDSPQKHPRITESEKKYLLEALSSSMQLHDQEQKRKIPWTKILTCSGLWINTIAQFGGIWGLFTILTQGPSYFRFVHKWDSTKIGLVSGLPHLFRSFTAIFIGQFLDYLLQKKCLTRNQVRKLATGICTIGNGIFVLLLAFSGCNALFACICMIIATACHGAVSSGPLAAVIDISPKYAGVLLGIINMICAVPGFVSPIVVSYFTYQNQSTESWKIVYLISAFLLIISGIIYVIFADSTQRKWNNPIKAKEDCDENNEELESLDKKTQK
ncbi:unnamed protein product [Chironomus riparius]|uniref:Major facilitator superfamily (MFS) profile domain-containing protein n=1 Tax=Chironomus riparius TaxID=315576 RepID=A0A9N9RNJ7_9DIPT|nr:unnamed protein product [Chironomus riparius]